MIMAVWQHHHLSHGRVSWSSNRLPRAPNERSHIYVVGFSRHSRRGADSLHTSRCKLSDKSKARHCITIPQFRCVITSLCFYVSLLSINLIQKLFRISRSGKSFVYFPLSCVVSNRPPRFLRSAHNASGGERYFDANQMRMAAIRAYTCRLDECGRMRASVRVRQVTGKTSDYRLCMYRHQYHH